MLLLLLANGIDMRLWSLDDGQLIQNWSCRPYQGHAGNVQISRPCDAAGRGEGSTRSLQSLRPEDV